MNDSKTIMGIADLPMNLNTKLTPSIQDKLVKIIDAEFQAQSTIYNSEIRLGEDKVLDRYRKIYKVDALLKEYNAVMVKINELQNEKSDELTEVKSLYEKAIDRINKRYEKRANALNKAEKGIQDALLETPFDEVGRLCDRYRTEKGKDGYKQVRAELDAVSLRHPQNLKNKIIARLLIATTTGEAMVILREVLGNGVLPTIKKDEYLALEDKR